MFSVIQCDDNTVDDEACMFSVIQCDNTVEDKAWMFSVILG